MYTNGLCMASLTVESRWMPPPLILCSVWIFVWYLQNPASQMYDILEGSAVRSPDEAVSCLVQQLHGVHQTWLASPCL